MKYESTIRLEKTTDSLSDKKYRHDWTSLLIKERSLLSNLKRFCRNYLENILNIEFYKGPSNVWNTLTLEKHHRSYGLPWCLGRDHFDYLITRGLKQNSKFLDLGCGSLRTGIWVIQYLNPGCYFGIDAHLQSLEAGINYEIPLHQLESKAPRLLISEDFDLAHFGNKFDCIFAFSLFIHLTDEQKDLTLIKIKKELNSGGRIIVNGKLPFFEDILKEKYGLIVTHQEMRETKTIDSKIQWYELSASN